MERKRTRFLPAIQRKILKLCPVRLVVLQSDSRRAETDSGGPAWLALVLLYSVVGTLVFNSVKECFQ